MAAHRKYWLLLTATVLAYTEAPGIQTQDCRLSSPWLPAVSAQCGALTVPEDPASPGGRQIQLFIARIPSLNAAPRPDPVVLIAGGPGQAASDLYLAMAGAFEQIRRDRDIIVVDQRGTGRSASLRCPVGVQRLETAEPQVIPGLMSSCLDALEGDPRFYTTSVAVQDLDRVRAALEIPQWNLYGVSYGTRVAQHYARRFASRARALILDGVVPSELAVGPAIAVNAQRALDLVFSRCEQDAQCAARFPRLAGRLDGLLARLAENPVTVTLPDPLTGALGERALTALHLKSLLRLMSYTPQTVALLPLLISEAHGGNYGPIAAQAYMMIEALERALSIPMHNAVVCTEDVPFFAQSPEGTEATYLGGTIVDALTAVCSVWPAGVMDADLRIALATDHPVLLLSGQADPVTPPAYGFQAIASLRNARHVIGPGQGHGLAGVGCVPRLMRAFLENPDPAALSARCIREEQPSPFFLDFTGPAP